MDTLDPPVMDTPIMLMPDTPVMDTLEILTKARTILAERGHTKGKLVDPETGGVCIAGALVGAVKGVKDLGAVAANRAELRMIEQCVEALGFGSVTANVCAWNNDPATTLEKVLALFDQAIARKARPPELNPTLMPRAVFGPLPVEPVEPVELAPV